MAQSVSISGMVVGPCTYFNMFPWPFWARGHADVLPPHCFSPPTHNLLFSTGDKGVRPSSARCLVGLSCHHLHDVWFELGTQLRLVFVPTPVCSPQWVSFSHGCYSIPLMMFPAQPRCWLVIAGSSGFCLGTQALEHITPCGIVWKKSQTFMVVVVAV